MTRQPVRLLLIVMAVLGSGAASAQDAAATLAEGPWSGSVSGGYLGTTGNSKASSANLTGRIEYADGPWTHTGRASANLASQREGSTAEAYTALGRTRFNFAERFYVFGSVEGIADRFSSFEYQISEALGLGWNAILPPKHRLDLEAGPGFRQSKLRDAPETPLVDESGTENDVIGLARLEYEWTISENASFLEKASMTAGADNTFYESISELKAGLVGNLSLVLGYIVRHNTDVQPGFRKTDTQTTISLEYAFGRKGT
jgi:putative salt-induced outer membrane protein